MNVEEKLIKVNRDREKEIANIEIFLARVEVQEAKEAADIEEKCHETIREERKRNYEDKTRTY